MKYLKFIVYAIIDILFNVICYLTNPFVLLFADDLGDLPNWAKWWANWDDRLDIDWMVDEHHVPSWAEYDFHKHYCYHTPEEALQLVGEYRGYVDLLDQNFTTKERFQRYTCRLIWLYRNCAYGFSYYVTGVDVKPEDVVEVKTDEKDGYTWFVTDYAFCYKDERPSFGKFHWDNFVGWKFRWVEKDVERCMLAFRITPFQ